jgi:hypothetical protein
MKGTGADTSAMATSEVVALLKELKPGLFSPAHFNCCGREQASITGAWGKWWLWKYRFARKEKRLSLGVYPELNLKNARGRRDELRTLLADGIAPSENRKATKSARNGRAANSFEIVAREWLVKYSPAWAASRQ